MTIFSTESTLYPWIPCINRANVTRVQWRKRVAGCCCPLLWDQPITL